MIHSVAAAVPSMTLPEGTRWPQRVVREGPKAAPLKAPQSCLPVAAAKFTPPSPGILAHHVGIYYSPASEHTESHVKSGHKPLRLAVPFLPHIQHSVSLMPLVSTQLPNRSLALSLPRHLNSSSPVLAPSMARLSIRPPPYTPFSTLSPSNYGSSHPASRGQWWTSSELRPMAVTERGGWTGAKWGSIRRWGWGTPPVMGREVVRLGLRKCHGVHIRSAHVWWPGVSSPLVKSCQQGDTRLEYALQWWFIGMRIKCPAPSKNHSPD